MIESKQQLLDQFRDKADAFLSDPGLMTGIDFDDAAVTLKRYVLTELRDQQLASKLAQFPKLIRRLDVTTLTALVAEVEGKLLD